MHSGALVKTTKRLTLWCCKEAQALERREMFASQNCSPPELEAKPDSHICAFPWDNMVMIKRLLTEGT